MSVLDKGFESIQAILRPRIAILLRLGLASTFLVSALPRWKEWDLFLDSVAEITPYLPDSMVPLAGLIATISEITFGVCLLVGFQTARVAFAASVLMFTFGVSMMLGRGWVTPFHHSVFTAVAAALVLASMEKDRR